MQKAIPSLAAQCLREFLNSNFWDSPHLLVRNILGIYPKQLRYEVRE
jgi:hypothetical protein